MNRLLFPLLLLGFMMRIGADEVKIESLPEGSVRETWELPSRLMGRPIKVGVLRPADPAPQGMPVLYALNGRAAPYLTFTEMPAMRRFVAAHPMLVVTFDADGDSGYVDATQRERSLFTRFFFEELMPEIARRYGADPERAAVTGFSMGGYGAFHYLLTRPDAFRSVSALSSAFSLFDRERHNPRWVEWEDGLLTAADRPGVMLYPRLRRRVLEEEQKLPPLLLLCGTEDFLHASNRAFVDELIALNAAIAKRLPEGEAEEAPAARARRLAGWMRTEGIEFEYRERPGGHDWSYWNGRAQEVAEFHWRHFAPPEK